VPKQQNQNQQSSINLNEVSNKPPGRILSYASATLSSSRRCFSAKTTPISSNQHTRNLINFSINTGKNIQDNFRHDINNIDKTLQLNGPLKQLDTVNSLSAEQEQNEKNDQQLQQEPPEQLEQTLASSSKQSIGRLSSARRNLLPGKTFTSQRKNSISYEQVVSSGKKLNELQQLKVPLSQYQVSGSAKKFYSTTTGPNIEGLKELALQHQKDIFALSSPETGSNTGGNKVREADNHVVIYGISEVKKESKLKEIGDEGSVDLKEQNSQIDSYEAYRSIVKNTGRLQSSLNSRKFRSILVESSGNCEDATNRPKTAKI